MKCVLLGTAMQGIELIEGDVFGERKDVQEYYNIEDSLEKQMDKDLRVIVLHDDNLSVHGADRFKILPASSMIIPGSKLDELAHLKGVKGIYEDQKLKVQAFRGNSPVEMKG